MKIKDGIITSRKNAAVLEAASLADKKNRDKTGLFAFEGIKLFCDAVRSGIEIDKVFVSLRAYEKYRDILCSAPSGELYTVSDEVYSKLTFENAPQGVFTVAKKREASEKPYGENAFVMILDTLGDPGNLGTVIRSAESFAVDTLIVGEGSADIYNPKCIRAAMGSSFRVDIRQSADLRGDVSSLAAGGFKIYAAMLDKTSKALTELSLDTGRVGFIVGNEGHGVREEVRDAATGSVIIPMAEGPESLNAAISASILAWEVFRRRGVR